MFLNASAIKNSIFVEVKEECKKSCVKKITVWSIVVQEITNIRSFYIFEYGFVYGAESLREMCPNTKLFLVRIQENADQK